MSFVLLPCLSLILLLTPICTFLLFIALRERRLAVKLRRSAPDKSSAQIIRLAYGLQFFLFMALGADFFLHGLVDSFCQGLLRPLWQGVLFCLGLSACLSLLSLHPRLRHNTFGNALLVVDAVFALGATLGICLLAWVFLRLPLLAPELLSADNLPVLSTLRLLPEWLRAGGDGALAALALAMTLAAGYVLAHGLCLPWYLWRRRRDDFGRDYYSQMIIIHARRASMVGTLLLVPLGVGLLALLPELADTHIAQLLPLARDHALIMLNVLLMGLPLAVLCWHFLGRAELPLQKKYLLFSAPVLLWVWFFAALARIWC